MTSKIGKKLSMRFDKAFPKLHMLVHTVEFIERYGFLSCLDEQPMESSYCVANHLYANHKNKSHDPAERHRRVLADMALHALQTLLQHEKCNEMSD